MDKNGDLCRGDDVLIGTDQSRITSVYLPGDFEMVYGCLNDAPTLKTFAVNGNITMGRWCFLYTSALRTFRAGGNVTMEYGCFDCAPDEIKVQIDKKRNATLLEDMRDNTVTGTSPSKKDNQALTP